MQLKGNINAISTDYISGNTLVTLSVEGKEAANSLSKLKDSLLSIEIKKWRNKRSLNANAYLWVLLQKIAEAINSDRWSVYIDMLQKYSRAYTFLIVKEDALPKLQQEWRTIIDLGEVEFNGNTGHQVQVFYGSSTFNTKEMSVLLNGVVNECKDLDIDTISPKELEMMVSLWNQ